jgi:F0F1-type ATP synthase assembly protein I
MESYSQSPDFVNTATFRQTNKANSDIKMTDEKKQERKELISYVKLHLDLIAVILVITYTGYLLYKANKGGK